MDIALAVEQIQYGSEYRGSVTANTEETWNAVIWTDTRIEKPTWVELEMAYKILSEESKEFEPDNL